MFCSFTARNLLELPSCAEAPGQARCLPTTTHTSDPRNSSSHSKGARGGTMAKAARLEALTLTWVSSYSIF
jgi:hypothetical protein